MEAPARANPHLTLSPGVTVLRLFGPPLRTPEQTPFRTCAEKLRAQSGTNSVLSQLFSPNSWLSLSKLIACLSRLSRVSSLSFSFRATPKNSNFLPHTPRTGKPKLDFKPGPLSFIYQVIYQGVLRLGKIPKNNQELAALFSYESVNVQNDYHWCWCLKSSLHCLISHILITHLFILVAQHCILYLLCPLKRIIASVLFHCSNYKTNATAAIVLLDENKNAGLLFPSVVLTVVYTF